MFPENRSSGEATQVFDAKLNKVEEFDGDDEGAFLVSNFYCTACLDKSSIVKRQNHRQRIYLERQQQKYAT